MSGRPHHRPNSRLAGAGQLGVARTGWSRLGTGHGRQGLLRSHSGAGTGHDRAGSSNLGQRSARAAQRLCNAKLGGPPVGPHCPGPVDLARQTWLGLLLCPTCGENELRPLVTAHALPADLRASTQSEHMVARPVLASPWGATAVRPATGTPRYNAIREAPGLPFEAARPPPWPFRQVPPQRLREGQNQGKPYLHLMGHEQAVRAATKDKTRARGPARGTGGQDGPSVGGVSTVPRPPPEGPDHGHHWAAYR